MAAEVFSGGQFSKISMCRSAPPTRWRRPVCQPHPLLPVHLDIASPPARELPREGLGGHISTRSRSIKIELFLGRHRHTGKPSLGAVLRFERRLVDRLAGKGDFRACSGGCSAGIPRTANPRGQPSGAGREKAGAPSKICLVARLIYNI